MTQRALVRQADVKRAVRGAIAAGLTVTGVRVDDAGVTVLTAETPLADPGGAVGVALRQAEARLDELYGEDQDSLLPGDQRPRLLAPDGGDARRRP
jgi:hypothetical protein